MIRLAPPPLRKGDELTLKWLNGIRQLAVEGQVDVGSCSGISASQGPNGIALGVSVASESGTLAYTDGTITARSGTTPGTGTVYLVVYDGTVLQIQNGTGGNPTVTQAVLNFSSTTGGIPTGTYVWIEPDPGSNWFITAVDCGN